MTRATQSCLPHTLPHHSLPGALKQALSAFHEDDDRDDAGLRRSGTPLTPWRSLAERVRQGGGAYADTLETSNRTISERKLGFRRRANSVSGSTSASPQRPLMRQSVSMSARPVSKGLGVRFGLRDDNGSVRPATPPSTATGEAGQPPASQGGQADTSAPSPTRCRDGGGATQDEPDVSRAGKFRLSCGLGSFSSF